ncbi:hypothetical protein [Sphingomonas sp. VNH70]|uniref:hypothetical protein n=1 Tax=Sphingomonas silueang TaxID=3156617 RepID=UPI0032B5738E
MEADVEKTALRLSPSIVPALSIVLIGARIAPMFPVDWLMMELTKELLLPLYIATPDRPEIVPALSTLTFVEFLLLLDMKSPT